MNKYYIHEFNNIPESCNVLKKSIVSGQDNVKDFIDKKLIQTNNIKDFVEQVKLYDNFYDSCIDERTRKTAIGKNKFYHRLKQLLGADNYRNDTTCNGKRYRSVFLNWRKDCQII